MSVRAITFDFWGTLFQDTGSTPRKEMRTAALARIASVDETAADKALEASYADFLRMHLEEQRTRTPEDAVEFVCGRLHVFLNEEQKRALAEVFATAILDYPPSLIEGAAEAVRAAAARFPIGIISDTGISPAASLRILLDREGLTPHFGAMAFSDEVGVAKPQAPMFHCAANGLKVQPGELLHIGDLEPTDIAGVQALGGTGALFAGVNRRYREETTARFTLDSWAEFIERLPELCGD